MAKVFLELPVPNASVLVRYYDRVMVFRAVSGQVQAGWKEITTPATRPPLRDGQVVYRYTDEDGDPEDLYAAGFLNSQTMAVSPIGEPVRGGGDPTEGLISVQDMKARYLFGLPLQGPRGEKMPDSLFRFWRQQAVEWVQQQVGVQLTTTIVEDETQDFVPSNISDLKIFLDTNLIPLQSVQRLRLDIPYQRVPRQVAADWMRIKPHRGRIYVYPRGEWLLGEGLCEAYGYFGPAFLSELIPGAWRIDYVAGFKPGECPADLLDAVGKAAALAPLMIAGDLIGKPGVTTRSLSIDTLSQSAGLVRNAQGGIFGARVTAYQAELQAVLPALRTRYRGIQLKGM